MAKKTNYQKNGSSYYRVTATIGKDENGKAIRKEFYGKSKKEAEAKRDDYLAGIRSGLSADYREHTIGELMRLWLFEVIKPSRADNTLVRYLNVYDYYIKTSDLYNRRLYSITSLDMQRFYNALSAEGKTHSMIFNTNKVLKAFFNYCIKQHYININPCMGAELPKAEAKTAAELEVDPFTDTEIQLILGAAKDYMYPLLTLAFATGLREGELLALRLPDIDLENHVVHVTKSLKATYECKDIDDRKRVVKIGDTKTQSSIRDVPLPYKIINTLKTQMLHQQMLFFKYRTPPEEQLLFTTLTGGYIDAHNLRRRWIRLLNKANVRYRKFHNIRHTYATKLFEADVNLKTIQVLLGHANIQTTSRIYVHVMDDVKSEAASKINYLFN